MSKLAKELGIELKSFCVETEGLTPQKGQDILDRCVDLGAYSMDGVLGSKSQKYNFEDYHKLSRFKYIGVGDNIKGRGTYLHDFTECYQEVLTKQEMLDYLQLHEDGDRLLPNEGMTEYEEPLKLTLDEIKDNLTTYSFLNERVSTKQIRDYLDYVYKLEVSKKERLDNEIKELENTLESKKLERSKL